MIKYSVFLAVIAVCVNCQQFEEKEPIKNYASLEDPFRMQKCNLVWNKARTKLTDKKLESLFSSLKLQDKSELTLKRVRSEGGDKDGSLENEVRKKFNSILVTFGLGGTPEDNAPGSSQFQSKTLFKDKKLQRLWEKAELAGIHGDELATLQDEFKHHQRQGECKGGRNCFWHEKDMKLVCVHRTSFLLNDISLPFILIELCKLSTPVNLSLPPSNSP